MQDFRVLVSIIGLLFLSGCFSEPPTPLKVGVNKWVGYEPLFLARSLGAYDEGIKLVELPNSSESISMLHNKLIDAAALTLDEVLSIINRGTPMTIILPFDYSLGADALVANKSIQDLPALKGKRLGVEASAVGAIMALSALNQAGLEKSDVIIVNLGVDQHFSQYQLGNIDAVITFEPVKSQLLKLGGHTLFDSSQVPGLIVDVLAVRTEVLKSKASA
ncbi:MAG: ABC transporter substrate-binding protein, partial [Ghiorsea sp.]